MHRAAPSLFFAYADGFRAAPFHDYIYCRAARTLRYDMPRVAALFMRG